MPTLDRRGRLAIALIVAAVAAVAVIVAGTGGNPEPAQPQATPSPTVDPARGMLTRQENDQNRDLDLCRPGAAELARCGTAPDITGTQQWFNTPGGAPVDLATLRGKVVLVDFFAYSCVNCRRDLPRIAAWEKAYAAAGLEVVSLHSPEFPFEKDPANLAAAIDELGLTWPVGQDNTLATWRNYRNQFWPAKYLIDATGTVRAITLGEGTYGATERQIRALLKEANPDVRLPQPVDDPDDDPDDDTAVTHRAATYLGFARVTSYRGPQRLDGNDPVAYTFDPTQPPGTFSFDGIWTVGAQAAVAGPGARTRLVTTANDVFHVLGGNGTVTVSVDGSQPRTIRVSGPPNLYELATADGPGTERTVTLTYSEGIEAYSFSYG